MSPAEVVDWTVDAVRYAPRSLPGHGPWRQGYIAGQSLAVCPNCQRRMFERGLRLHGAAAPWREGADAGRQCIGGCGFLAPREPEVRP